MSSDRENSVANSTSGENESRNNEWEDFDGFEEIRNIISAENCGGEYDLPCWYPKISMDPSFTDTSGEGQNNQSQNRLPNIAQTKARLMDSLSSITTRLSENKETMTSLISDVSEYINLPSDEREQYDIAEVIGRSELIKREYNKLQYDVAILSFDIQSASRVSIGKSSAQEWVDSLFKIVFDVGVTFEKCMFIVILLKAELENYAGACKVSESVRIVKQQVKSMMGWNTQTSSEDDTSDTE